MVNEKRDIAFINVNVVDPSGKYSGVHNVFTNNGVISEISGHTPSKRAEIIDCTGKHLFPAFVDVHVHLRDPGFTHKEDILSGSRSAVAGGFASIFAMPNTNPVCDNADVVRYILEESNRHKLANVYPVGAISKNLKGQELSDIEGMAKAGCVALSDDGACVQVEDVMRDAMLVAKKLDLVVIDHPEDFSITKNGIINEGSISKKLSLAGISRDAENFIIERDIKLCRETGSRLHVAHLSTKEGVELVRLAKREGLLVTCEVTPHHLFLTEEDVERLGANAKMKPPLRTKVDQIALIEAIVDETIDVIATDHAPHTEEEKKDITTAAFGCIGLETSFSICAKLVHEKIISIEKLASLMSSRPAEIFKLQTGRIEVGYSADLTIVDMNDGHIIDANMLFSKSRNCPFVGEKVKGRVTATFIAGKKVFPFN